MKNDSKHFTVEEITDGVWATINTPGGSHICNSGIINLGEETLIFDTGLCTESANDLKNAALALTGRIPSIVVNSHLHNDHFWGNHVFHEAKMSASRENVRITEPKWKQDAERYYNMAKGAIEEARKLLDSESEHEREYAKILTGFLSGIIETGPSLEYKTPDITFDGSMSLEGSKRNAEIIEYRNGHSESDCVLHLSEEKIVFTGDLCYIGYHPCLDFGDPLNTLNIIDQLKALEAVTVVPGHGFVGNSSAFDDMKEYIRTLVDLVKGIVSNEGSQEDAEAIAVPEKYLGLQMMGFFYKRNLSCLYKILSS
ncbi:MAG: MBL fold metallo-hydrolase [Candidatus Adiutricales bacterium]